MRATVAVLLAVLLFMPCLAQDGGPKKPDVDRPRGDKGGKHDGGKDCCACPHPKTPPPLPPAYATVKGSIRRDRLRRLPR